MLKNDVEAPPAPGLPPGSPVPYALQRVGTTHPQRAAIETTIRRRYWRAHRATRCHFLEHLLLVGDACGPLRAALGIGEGRRGRFFLEAYLDEPVDGALSARAGVPVARADTVEIGTLVSFHPSAATQLLLLTVAWLGGYGAKWGVFTATEEVRDRLHALGLSLLDLGGADPARLGDAAREWGRYYRARPRVVAASFEDACRLISFVEAAHAAAAHADGARARIEGIH